MILIKVGNTKICCKKKNGEDKWFKATPEVLASAKSNFKIGDSVKCDFNDTTYIIEKITAETPKGGGGYKGGGSKNGQYDNMIERSVLAAASNVVASMSLVKIVDVKIAIQELFHLGMELVKGAPAKAEASPAEPVETEENPEPAD